MRPKVYKLQKFEIYGRRRSPRGFRMVQKFFSNSASSYFLLQMINSINIITIKYSQKYFEITFGWTNVLPKNSKLKLVFKEAEKEPKKAFLGILACFGGSQYEALQFLNINFLILRKQPWALDLFSQPWKMIIFPKTRSRMLVKFL